MGGGSTVLKKMCGFARDGLGSNIASLVCKQKGTGAHAGHSNLHMQTQPPDKHYQRNADQTNTANTTLTRHCQRNADQTNTATGMLTFSKICVADCSLASSVVSAMRPRYLSKGVANA